MLALHYDQLEIEPEGLTLRLRRQLGRVRLSWFGAVAWRGIIAPAGTPKPIVAKINAAIAQALKIGGDA